MKTKLSDIHLKFANYITIDAINTLVADNTNPPSKTVTDNITYRCNPNQTVSFDVSTNIYKADNTIATFIDITNIKIF